MGRSECKYRLFSFAAVLVALFCPFYTAYAADVYDEQLHVVIEKVTEGDIPKLIELMGDPDATVRFKATSFLGGFGEKAVPDLLEALEKGKNRAQVIGVLGSIKDPRTMAPLFKYVDDKDADVSYRSRQALIDMADMSASFLIDRLENKEKIGPDVYILSNIGRTDELASRLRKMLANPAAELRISAMQILAAWNDTASTRDFEALLADKDRNVREKAVEAYKGITADYDQRVLVPLLKDESEKVRSKAAEMLADVKGADPALINAPLLDVAKNDKSTVVRINAIYALGKQKVSLATVFLIEELKDPVPAVQETAVDALGNIEAEEAVPYILDMLKAHKPGQRSLLSPICDSLIRIGKPVDIEMFLPYLTSDISTDDQIKVIELVKKFVTDSNRDKAVKAVEDYMSRAQVEWQKSAAQDALDSIRRR